jgi:hypothetical protein
MIKIALHRDIIFHIIEQLLRKGVMKKIILIFVLTGLCWAVQEWGLIWNGSIGYEWDGVEPDYFQSDSLFAFKIKYVGLGEPVSVSLNLDRNADGFFSNSEQLPMRKERKDSTGVYYTVSTSIGKPRTRMPLAYYFSAQVGYTVKTSALMLGPFFGSKVSFKLVGDSTIHFDKAVAPLEILINSENNKFLLVNDGEVPIRFGLCIDRNGNSLWQPVTNSYEIGENKYILSAIFLKPTQKKPRNEQFNTKAWEDALNFQPRFCFNDRFTTGKNNSVEICRPGDTLALWFNFMAPSTSSGPDADQLQTIGVKIFAVEE